MGWKHHGGFVFGAFMLAIITFVWKTIVGKKADESIEEGTTAPEVDNSNNLQEDVALNGKEQIEQQKEVTFQQDGIPISMVLSSDVIEQMERIKTQEPGKWENNGLKLVREAKREIGTITKVAAEEENESEKITENDLESETETTFSDIDTPKDTVVSPSSNMDMPQPFIENENPQPYEKRFGNKLESEYRREIILEPHWIRQNGTDICVKIGEAVYERMIELQNREPQKWRDKEFDLFMEAKRELSE